LYEEKKMRVGISSQFSRPSIEALFKSGGVEIHNEKNVNLVASPEVEYVFARAQEVPRHVECGTLDCGLTGRVWTIEGGRQVVSVAELECAKFNFGKVSWVLAVPDDSDCRVVGDLAGKVVTTEIVRTTKDYFDCCNIPARVEFSWGPVETHQPVLADAIVVSADGGAFVYEGRWRVLDTVLESATELISSRQAWADMSKRKEIENLALILCGKLHAQDRVGLMFTVRNKDLEAALQVLPPGQKSTIFPLKDEMWVTVNTVIEDTSAWSIVPKLKAAQAENIVEFPISKVLL
jgi:ATP phosphoribosyltransferase